jgi:Protein of unknown function (DUF4239)
MGWLSGVPILIALPLCAALFAGVAVAAHTMLRRVLPPPERLSEHHEVPGFLMGVVGVLYSVVLGFLVGTVWTSFASAQATADLEAGHVGDAFNYAGQLPHPEGAELQRILARYAIVVRAQDWSAQPDARTDTTAKLLYDAVALAVQVPKGNDSSSSEILERNTIRSALIETLRQLGDTRRLRAVQSQSRLPPGLIEALLLGAVGVIAFTFLFGVRSYAKQMTMTALLAGSIGLFFGLTIELSTPYSGAIHVSRDAWDFVIASNHLERLAK